MQSKRSLNCTQSRIVRTSLISTLFVVLAAVSAAIGAEARVGFRGDGTGSFPDAQPPVKWSATENVVWKTPMPGRCNGGPILVGDRVFTCAEPSTLLCLAAADGKILWSDTVTCFDYVPEDDPEAVEIIAKVKAAKTEAERQEVKKTLRKDILRCDYFELPPVMGSHFGFIFEYAMPTPASDGQQVYAVYGTGMTAAYDLAGKRTWVRALAKPTSATGYSANPLLAGGRLVICMGGRLYGLDPATGKSAWEVDHREHHGSPVRATVGGTELVVMPKGRIYRASDGTLLAEGATINNQLTAVVNGDIVYSSLCDSFGHGPAAMRAVRLKPGGDGQIVVEKLWETKEIAGNYSSPVYHDGLIYNTCNDAGDFKGWNVVAFDAATGKVVYRQKLNVKSGISMQNACNFPCITQAGSHIYAPMDQGHMWVIQPGREYKEVALNTLSTSGGWWSQGDQMVGAPLFVGTRYVRSHKFLWCIGNK